MAALNVFISYSHKDGDLLEELEAHLSALHRQGSIQTWHDRNIEPGESWRERIENKLETAEMILLLVSPSFIASDECWVKEMRRALERNECGEARVIPVIVRPCDWRGTPLGDLQALPPGGQAVTSWDDRDQAWLAVVRGVQQVSAPRNVPGEAMPRNVPGDGSSKNHRLWPFGLLALALLVVGLMALRMVSDRQMLDRQMTGAPKGMVAFDGVSFFMGSSEEETGQAFAWCEELAGDVCRREVYAREQPRHPVMLSPFAIDAVEVGRSAFVDWLNGLRGVDVAHIVSLAGSGIELQPDGTFAVQAGQENLPASHVTWFGAREYCRDRGKRLPTEAEWEFAARGAPQRPFPWGKERPDCTQVVFARRGDLPCIDWGEGPVAVTTELGDRTPEGVLHLGGNVSEWVEDSFFPYEDCREGCRDPVREGGTDRVYRGGSWGALADLSRAAGRNRRRPDEVHAGLGFRCAITLERSAEPGFSDAE